MDTNNLAPEEVRYFTSATCPLGMALNWMSGQVAKRGEWPSRATRPVVLLFYKKSDGT